MTTILQKDGEVLDNKISSISDFFQLMKPRVMSLVIFTALIGYFCGVFSTETILNPYLSMIGILAIALGAGSSGVLNQWYDREVDSMMERTKNRPIPKGKIEPSDALAFGLIGSILSIVILGLCINWLAGFLLFFYNNFLCCFLHYFFKKIFLSKYCYWWCIWCLSTCNWICVFNGVFWCRGINFIWDHFFMDTTTFLGISSKN